MIKYDPKKNPYPGMDVCKQVNGGYLPDECEECVVFVLHPPGYPSTPVKTCLYEHMSDAYKQGYEQALRDVREHRLEQLGITEQDIYETMWPKHPEE